jgi:hypothetical protein
MNLFWILWIFTAVMSVIPVYFFFIGLKDGSITSRNLILWIGILLTIGAVLYGSLWLRGHNRLPLAEWLLGFAAVPGVLVLLYFLVVIISKPRWN